MKQSDDMAVPQDSQCESPPIENISYPCGCNATGLAPLPKYCPDHTIPTGEQLWKQFFKSAALNPWEASPAQLSEGLRWVWMDGWVAGRSATGTEATTK